jgi:XTP/dITP diphosphohydrolase
VRIYCATSNPGKLREFQRDDFEIVPVSLPPPEEAGRTFEENALLKARYYGAHVNGYLFGVDSAHFDNDWLLKQLRAVENRTARFVCVIALVLNGEPVKMFRGVVEGRVVDEPRGSNGFGYDPLFYYEPFGCTFGEADAAAKMRVSHRAQALEAMFTFLRSASI